MPKRTIVIDYRACDPARCPEGVCQAALLCDRKVLTQEAPYELPDVKAAMCLGCSLCLPACPQDAICML
jgi:translation initiation factor RLI1